MVTEIPRELLGLAELEAIPQALRDLLAMCVALFQEYWRGSEGWWGRGARLARIPGGYFHRGPRGAGAKVISNSQKLLQILI